MSTDKKLERLIKSDCLTALLYYRHNLCSTPECLATTNLKRCGECMDRYLTGAAETRDDDELDQAIQLLQEWRRTHSD